MKTVLVITDADPRATDRALESLRMCVGLASGGHRVRLRVEGPARALADPAAAAFPNWRRAEDYLEALGRLGGAVEAAEGAALPAEDPDVVIRWGG